MSKRLRIKSPVSELDSEIRSETTTDKDEDKDKKNVSLTEKYEGKVMKNSVAVDPTGKSSLSKISLYGYPLKATALQKEQTRHERVVKKFFRIDKQLVEGRPSHILYNRITDQLKCDDQDKKPIKLDGYDRRSVIIVLSKILTEKNKMPTILFEVGITKISLVESKKESRKRQMGNCEMKIDGMSGLKYGKILMSSINGMTHGFGRPPAVDAQTDARKKKLLQLIAKKLPKISAFTLLDFNKYQRIRLEKEDSFSALGQRQENKEALNKKVHLLNSLLFLITIVEVIVRFYRIKGEVHTYDDLEYKEDKNKAIASDSFPVAIAQSRSLELLVYGEITFDDFLGESTFYEGKKADHRARYGAMTGQRIIDNLKILMDKFSDINSKFHEMSNKRGKQKEFVTTYEKYNTSAYFVDGGSRICRNLLWSYGHGNESGDDESDYSSDEDDRIALFTP
ncbi:MAG: hypothetical protein JSR33_05480 [Proteobacteria bacterium]|nr:hypothetical protein [Pseudomonadota bacterium]